MFTIVGKRIKHLDGRNKLTFVNDEMPDVAAIAPVGQTAWDLTPILAQSLDRHLLFPLLEFLEDKKVYDEHDVLQHKSDLLQRTNLVDFEIPVYQRLHNTEDVPAELTNKRERVVARLLALQEESRAILVLFKDQEVVKQLRQDKLFNIQFLQDQYGLRPETIDMLYQYSKFQFDCGNYAGAAETLYHFRILSTDQDKNLSALWGKLASEILVQNWDSAVEDLANLRQYIDQRQSVPPLQTLQQRTWLLTWSLFVFFNHSKGRDSIIDLFIQPQYKQTIQTTCPHMLRYLATAVVMNKRRREILKELVTMIQQETHTYRDPIVEFVECLYVNFDFDAAQQKLRECEQVFGIDFFLEPFLEEFIENARLFIFETYCKIHKKIDLGMLAEKLNMRSDEAERWIVDLIRNAQLDAKIDSEGNSVIMGQQTQSVYQQVIEKTKGLTFRTHVLVNNIEKREAQIHSRIQGGGGGNNSNDSNANSGYQGTNASNSGGGYKGRDKHHHQQPQDRP